jgi:hypothetical protein
MRLRFPLAAGATLALALACVLPDAAAADPKPDYALFKERIEPTLQQVCAACHAGKGRGQFALVVHAPGAPFPEADHRKNYETALRLVVPGNPDKSKFLQKPLANSVDGVPHGGGDRIFPGTEAHRAWLDFINGIRGKGGATPAPAPAAAKPAVGTGVVPDFGYFVARVEPTLLGVCAQCHAGAGKGQFALVTHLPGSPFPVADHKKNYDTVCLLLVPGKPMESKFLLKPLAERDGGVKHEGGDRIAKGDGNYVAWTEFIGGTKGPPPPEDAPPEEVLPTVQDKGLVLQAEDMTAQGDAAAGALDGATGKAMTPGAGGGTLRTRFRVGRSADYAVVLHAAAGPRGFRVRIDGSEPVDVEAPKSAWGDVSPRLPLDEGKPLEGRHGRLTVVDGAVRMDGRQGTARFLSPADLAHSRVEAKFEMPPVDDPSRDDAWLLFDCLDSENGKFFGLADGGRRVVMGVIERKDRASPTGVPRILKSIARPEGTEGKVLAVDLLDGLAVGRLDGKPVIALNFDAGLGAAKFGFLTHGAVALQSLVATRSGEEVHRAKFGEGGVFDLRRGNHVLEVEMLPSGAPLDAVTIKDCTE